MAKTFITFILGIVLLCTFASMEARQPYHATVTVGTDSAMVSDPNLVDLSRSLKGSSIQQLIPLYTPTSAVAIDINLRGIAAIAGFATNSTTLVVVIPQTGVVETFTGATRDQSIALFKNYVQDAGTRHNLLRAYAKYSPIDPIAGNPNSLMAQMAQADYLLGHLSPLTGCDCCWSAQPIVHQFQVGLNSARAFSDGYDTTTVGLPLRYSYSPKLSWAFIIDAPLIYIRNGGASSINGSLGLGLRYPITHNWSLTPIVRLGSGGSLDLCASGNFFSAGLTSVYNYKIRDYVLSMTNNAGYITSTNLWLTGINFNYHLQNYILKNGLSLTSCEGFCLCNRPVNVSVSFVDSYFTTDRLFIRHYDEIGVSLITSCLNPRIDYDCLTVGFAYQFGQKSYRGYSLNLAYQF